MADADPKIVESLVQACFEGKLDAVRSLIESGIDINAVEGWNWNPLHAAIENMEADVVRYLLEAGADLEFVCLGCRPLHHTVDIEIDAAIQANTADYPEPILTKLLLTAGADRNATDEQGQTPLQMAVGRRHQRAVELLRSR